VVVVRSAFTAATPPFYPSRVATVHGFFVMGMFTDFTILTGALVFGDGLVDLTGALWLWLCFGVGLLLGVSSARMVVLVSFKN
jgi:hypothetical protein